MWSAITKDGGFTLLEMLAALALTAMVSTVVASLLFTTLATRRNIQQRTDGHESLRIAATVIMEDGRFAVRASCGWDYLQLYTNPSSAADYVLYQFADQDGVPDPNHLHRIEVKGGSTRDDVVGWNLVPPDFSGMADGTQFECDTSTTYRRAWAHLVQPPLEGQTNGVALDVTAFFR